MSHVQQTIAAPVTLTGVGLHSGAPVTLTIAPAAPQAGLNFVRTDVADKPNVVPARYDRVVDTRLCTVIANEAGVSVATIEHLMAALRGADIHNATLEISAGEVPALDGSSAPFLAAIDRVGVVSQGARLQMLKVLEPVAITQGDKTVRLDPAEQTSFAGTIDFAHAAIGNQIHTVQMLNGNFRHEIAAARTFGLFEEVEMMRAAGFARGGSLENAIVVDKNGVLNPEGLRFDNEFIRHKLLDAIGDMYLAGYPILGAYHGTRPSHALNNALLRKLFATPNAYTLVTSTSP